MGASVFGPISIMYTTGWGSMDPFVFSNGTLLFLSFVFSSSLFNALFYLPHIHINHKSTLYKLKVVADFSWVWWLWRMTHPPVTHFLSFFLFYCLWGTLDFRKEELKFTFLLTFSIFSFSFLTFSLIINL